VDTSETEFEAQIQQALLDQGYTKRRPGDYDREHCLDPGMLLDFVQATQPDKWEKLEAAAKDKAGERVIDRVSRDIATHGTSHVFHEGVKVSGVKFRLVFFPPASTRNEEDDKLAKANLFSVVRQLRYGTRPGEETKEIDWTIFLNGLPLFPVELKNRLTHQKARHAVAQWKTDRDHPEPLFRQGRCLAFFAVDDEVVQFASHLKGQATVFWPFNKGKQGGAGNPPSHGYATEYLWKEVFAPASVLALIEHFVHLVEDEDDQGKKTGTRTLLFPRYHQYKAVLEAVAHAKSVGVGTNYLFQHSAGSGKSNTIAWLSNLLSILHDNEDEPVFNSVVILTDRRILDRQLQGVLRRFQRTVGVLENIDKHSRQLKDALESGKKIIVTTIQKFPVIAEEIGSLPGQRFAIVIDEAHSGQGPETTKALKKTLAVKTLDEAEEADEEKDEADVLEEKVTVSMLERGKLDNVSVFAFTATPGPKTLQLFGTKQADGQYRPFSLYTRRQAIHEHFIVDVLETYFTYESYWRLMKKIDDDPKFDRSKASAMLKKFVSLDPNMIEQKVTIALDAFDTLSKPKIAGRAKAMFVCPSRLHAVRVKLEMDRQIKERKLDYKALVAFSGTVRDPKTEVEHTEQSMNGISEKQIAATFATDQYRFLIVANKFQTGFDQPLLHTMIVDKLLRGQNAVQTLERLNRIHPQKKDTLVLDFYNETDEIEAAFKLFHEETSLEEGTDPDTLYDLEGHLRAHELFEEDEVEAFANVWFDEKANQSAVHSVLATTVDRYEDADEATRATFRGQLAEYVRIYGFLVQLIEFVDTDLEKLYLWGRVLLTKLPTPEGDLPVGLQPAIDLESLKVAKTGEHTLSLDRGRTALDPVKAGDPRLPKEREMAPLSSIIKDLNDHFGISLTEEDRVTLLHLEAKLDENAGLEKAFEINVPSDARLSFDQVAGRTLAELLESNVKFLRTVANEDEIRDRLMNRLFQRYVARHHERGQMTSQRRRALSEEIPTVAALISSGDTGGLAAHINRSADERGLRLAERGRRRS
jgi:type I restriction enzyme R subunit